MRAQGSRYALTLLLGSLLPVTAQAVDLSLTSTAPDLNSLVVGETLTVRVELSDLGGLELDSLSAVVSYPSALLGTPVVSPGSIIPNASDFVSFSTPVVDGSFFSFTEPIVTEGVFYSFDVEVIAAGNGSIDFGFVDASEEGGGFLTPATGGSLSFTSSVPEPNSLLLVFLTITSLLLMRPVHRHLVARRNLTVCG